MAPKCRIGEQHERAVCSICWGIMSRYPIAYSSARCSSRKPQKRFAFAAPYPWLRRTHDLYDFYTPFPRSGIPRERSRIHKTRGAREKERRGRATALVFLRLARKSRAFHTLFMKYIFQQDSSTTCTQPRSDKIDGNVYIRG